MESGQLEDTEVEDIVYLKAGRKDRIDLSRLSIAPPKRLLINISRFTDAYCEYLEKRIIAENEEDIDEEIMKICLSLFKHAKRRVDNNERTLQVQYAKNRIVLARLVQSLNLFFNKHTNTLESMLGMLETGDDNDG